jgi:hypothetical protein
MVVNFFGILVPFVLRSIAVKGGRERGRYRKSGQSACCDQSGEEEETSHFLKEKKKRIPLRRRRKRRRKLVLQKATLNKQAER